MRHTSAMFASLLLFAGPAFAGGDYSRGIVRFVSQSNGFDVFQFVQPANDRALIEPCKTYLVAVRSSPRGSTEAALKYLRLASKNKTLVNFGYMGSGLIETSMKCTYLAETVEIGEEFGKVFVLARRDET